MKRHPALEKLSRDHHHALVVAQRLKRADQSGADQARSDFLSYRSQRGSEHFREEEEILLPALARFTDPHQELIARVLTDHVAIRRDALELANGASLEVLHGLGRELEAHVRREERELFALIERLLPERELVRLAVRLSP
jgi:iron-sulfur cluster repair protein YtfE (RIC family)